MWVCEGEENLTGNIHLIFMAEEHRKLSGRLNTIAIINGLNKNRLKILVSIPVFGRLIREEIKTLYYKAFIIMIYFIRPNKMFLGIINENAFSAYILMQSYECATVGDFQHFAERAAAPSHCCF